MARPSTAITQRDAWAGWWCELSEKSRLTTINYLSSVEKFQRTPPRPPPSGRAPCLAQDHRLRLNIIKKTSRLFKFVSTVRKTSFEKGKD